MKRVLVIFLACIFTLYIGGVQVTYWLKIDNTKGKAFTHIKNAKLNKNETRDFTFTKQQYSKLNWNEKNKEFSYDNQDYDIINVTYSANMVKLTCYKDDLETEVVTVFNNIFDKFFSPTQQSKNTENNIAGKIFKEYLPQECIVPMVLQANGTNVIFWEKNCNSFSFIESKWQPPTLC